MIAFRLRTWICLQRVVVDSARYASSCTNTGSRIIRPFSEIPTPKRSIPFLGHSLRLKNGFNVAVKQMFEEVNSPILRLKIPGSSMVITKDPNGAKDMYTSEGKYPERNFERNFQWFYNKMLKDYMDLPLVFQSGPEWQENRNDLGKLLAPTNVYGYVHGFNRISDRLIRNIKEVQDSEGYIDNMQELLMYWNLENGAWFALGVDLDARLDHHEEALKLRNVMQDISEVIDKFSTALPIYKIFPTPFLRKAKNSFMRVNEYGMIYADRHMDQIMEGVKKGETHYGQSLLEQWLIEGKLTKKQAVKNAMDMIIVAFDSTANLIGFMLYELSKRKDIQDKIHDQVVSILGKDGEPDKESLQKMPYLMNVIKEAQRISSVITGHVRRMPQDTTILGYEIPADTVTMYHLFSANQCSSLYKNPNKFDPDRWDTDDINPYAYMGFGIGPRGCWGRRFVEIQLKVFLAKLCQHFTMESDYPVDARMPFKETALLRVANPIRIKFKPR